MNLGADELEMALAIAIKHRWKEEAALGYKKDSDLLAHLRLAKEAIGKNEEVIIVPRTVRQ